MKSTLKMQTLRLLPRLWKKWSARNVPLLLPPPLLMVMF